MHKYKYGDLILISNYQLAYECATSYKNYPEILKDIKFTKGKVKIFKYYNINNEYYYSIEINNNLWAFNKNIEKHIIENKITQTLYR